MKDIANNTVFTLSVSVDSSSEYLDSIHASRESAEKRRKHLVDHLDYLYHDVVIEPRPILSL